MKEQRKEHFDNIDLLKGIAILAVIMIHTELWDTNLMPQATVGNYVQYAMRLASEGVPLFVMINGFLLFSKEAQLGAHLQKIGKLIFLFLFWATVMATAGILVNHGDISLENILHIVLQTHVGSLYTGVLWFLQNLTAVYILFPLLKLAYDKAYEIYRFAFGVVGFFFLGNGILQMLVDYFSLYGSVTLLQELQGFLTLYTPMTNLCYLFYFMLGGILYRNKDKVQQNRVRWSLIGVVTWIFAIAYGIGMSKRYQVTFNPAYNFESIFMVGMVIGAYAFSSYYRKSENCIGTLIRQIGQSTMGIYVLHMNVIVVATKLWRAHNWLGRLGLTAVVFALSFLLASVLKRLPIVHHMVDMAPIIRKKNKSMK